MGLPWEAVLDISETPEEKNQSTDTPGDTKHSTDTPANTAHTQTHTQTHRRTHVDIPNATDGNFRGF